MATIPGLGGLNNDAHNIDDKGNVQVDFVWGNFPLQPNDDRDSKTVFSAKTRTVTAASGNGTTVTYTVNHGYAIGELVTITGLSTAAFNLNGVAVASIIYTNNVATGFTVTNSATGTAVTSAFASVSPNATNLDFTLNNHVRVETGYNGYPLYTPNNAGAFSVDGSGKPLVAYTIVPQLIGDTLATALDNISDAGLVIGTQSTITNTPIAYTVVTRTAGSFDATITATAGVALCPVGAQIVLTGTVAGTFTVKSVSSTNLITFTTGASTVLTAGTGTVAGVTGTIQAQSIAAGTASTALGTTINITPYA